MHRLTKVPVLVGDNWHRYDVVCEHATSNWGLAVADDLILVHGEWTDSWVATFGLEREDLPAVVNLLTLAHITHLLK